MRATFGFRAGLLVAACASVLSVGQGDDGLPLRIENLLAPAGGSEISYSVRHTAYGSETADALSLRFGYSYGLLKDTEIGLSLSGSYTDNRNANRFRDGRCRYDFELSRYVGCRDEKDTTARLSTLGTQVSHSFSPENETPGVYGWLGIDLLENQATEGEDFERSNGDFNAGLSLYRTYDPIVLRVAFGYVHRPPENTPAGRWDRGDTITVSPSVSFAVNHIVSITATTDIQMTQGDALDGLDDCIGCDYRRTVVYTGLGVSLSLRDRTALYISSSSVASGSGGASFGAFVRHRLKRFKLLEDESSDEGVQHGDKTGSWSTWWAKHRVRVWGIATGLAAAVKVRNIRR